MKPRPSRRKLLKRRIQVFLASSLGPPLLKLISRTWKVRRIGLEHREAATADGDRPVFALWHQHVPTAVGTHTDYGIRILASRHHDGDITSGIAEKLGYTAVRGSSSAGGAAAMRELLRLAEHPDGYALTPDGPRGPARSVKPGVLYLSATIRRPLVATGFSASKFWQTRSWDSMRLPKPFAKVVISYGPGHEVPRAALRDDTLLSAESARLVEAMDAAQASADEELARWLGDPQQG